MEKLLNPSELAEILNVRPGTIYSWLSRGVDIPPFVKVGGCTRWREQAVKKWIEVREKERRHRNFED